MLRRLAAKQQSLSKLNDNLQVRRNGLLMQRESTAVNQALSKDVSNGSSMESVNHAIGASQDQILKVISKHS